MRSVSHRPGMGCLELDRLRVVVDLVGFDPDRVDVRASREGITDLLQRFGAFVNRERDGFTRLRVA